MCSRSAEPLSRVRTPGFPAPVRRGQRRDASLRYRLVCTTVTTVRLNARNGMGLCTVFHQSYHSVFYLDSYKSNIFRDWQKRANRYH